MSGPAMDALWHMAMAAGARGGDPLVWLCCPIEVFFDSTATDPRDTLMVNLIGFDAHTTPPWLIPT